LIFADRWSFDTMDALEIISTPSKPASILPLFASIMAVVLLFLAIALGERLAPNSAQTDAESSTVFIGP
jgi:hypothetical protein